MKKAASSSQSLYRSHRSVPFRNLTCALRYLHTSPTHDAVAHPITAHGPPPTAPLPAVSQYGDRVDRKRKMADLLRQGQEIRATQSRPAGVLRRRFWKDVFVKEVEYGYQVFLDTRPVRTPSKAILTIPASKPHLASAIALEWDLLTSASQALKQHLIPMTSITARAEDVVQQDSNGISTFRNDIVRTVMGYLDTDTLLCWAPQRSARDTELLEKQGLKTESLRDQQIRIAQPIIAFLSADVWPGVEIKPVLNPDSIVPTPQPQITKEVIRGWVSGLPAYELAALERGVLASKSLMVATRFLIEWSEAFRHLQREGRSRFGIDEAAEASSLEVRYQTGMWGEVEDTHDVEKEDLKRQLGSVILLVSGSTR